MAVHPNAARPSSPASPVTPAVPASGIPPVSPRSEPAARPVKADLPVLSLGADVGSTTAKIAVLRGDEILYTSYERHYSRIRETLVKMLRDAAPVLGDSPFTAAVSGSAGLGLAEGAGIPFVQEVWATGEVVKTLEHDVSCVIELGGEDAKIIFFKGGADERMNGTCAGGTGAFIDQMASLLDVTPDELDELALNHKKIYPIASRCGVFAKSDVQPLLNQGASREDIAASVYQAVVNQTVAGLAQGRKIEGRVLFLGGPLSFCRGLRDRFVETLGLKEEEAVFPPYARNAVSLGAALYSRRIMTSDPNCLFTLDALADKIENAKIRATSSRTDPLFRNREEYEEFSARHAKASVPAAPIEEYEGGASLGIDCGSTTTKLALVGEGGELLYTYYAPNRGNPVGIVRQELSSIYALCGDRVKIRASAVTGYGEDLIRHAFGVDYGVVETVAHYTAAKHFLPDVDFILDIGGQDIKCFRIRAGAVDKIMLNEACSSGCGSFIETFARSMHLTAAEFAQRALFASAPVNLGSRCTVFMNSQVKQSQKDGATVEDISAGLSLSVVKNAIYKVIRAHSPDELGERIVVQGGTFFNDAVLRAFEREIGREVIRPNIAGLMGAYGAALYAADRKDKEEGQNAGTPEKPASKLISPSALASFTHQSRTATCGGCENRCLLTVNTFPGGRKFISGNKCERGAGQTHVSEDVPNLHAFKRGLLLAEAPQTLPPASETGPRGTVGLPLLHPGALRYVVEGDLRARAVLDPLGHRLLPREDHARAYRKARRDGRGRGVLSPDDVEPGRTRLRQPLQLPGRRLLQRTAPGEHGLPEKGPLPLPLSLRRQRKRTGGRTAPRPHPDLARHQKGRDQKSGLGRIRQPREVYLRREGRGRAGGRMGKGERQEGDDPRRTPLPRGRGDRTRHRQAGGLPRIRGGVGGFDLPPREDAGGRAGPESVDLPFPSVPGGGVGGGEPGRAAGAARVLRLRRRRHHDGRGQADPRERREILHPDQDRRDRKPRRGEDPAEKSRGGALRLVRIRVEYGC